MKLLTWCVSTTSLSSLSLILLYVHFDRYGSKEEEKEPLEQRDPRSEDGHPRNANRHPSRSYSRTGESLYRYIWDLISPLNVWDWLICPFGGHPAKCILLSTSQQLPFQFISFFSTKTLCAHCFITICTSFRGRGHWTDLLSVVQTLMNMHARTLPA